MAKYVLKRGKHHGMVDGVRTQLEPGAVVELNDAQAEAFKDRFVSLRVHEAEKAAETARLEESKSKSKAKSEAADENKAAKAKEAQEAEKVKVEAENKTAGSPSSSGDK